MMSFYMRALYTASSSSAVLEQAQSSTHDTARDVTNSHDTSCLLCRVVTQQVDFVLITECQIQYGRTTPSKIICKRTKKRMIKLRAAKQFSVKES